MFFSLCYYHQCLLYNNVTITLFEPSVVFWENPGRAAYEDPRLVWIWRALCRVPSCAALYRRQFEVNLLLRDRCRAEDPSRGEEEEEEEGNEQEWVELSLARGVSLRGTTSTKKGWNQSCSLVTQVWLKVTHPEAPERCGQRGKWLKLTIKLIASYVEAAAHLRPLTPMHSRKARENLRTKRRLLAGIWTPDATAISSKNTFAFELIRIIRNQNSPHIRKLRASRKWQTTGFRYKRVLRLPRRHESPRDPGVTLCRLRMSMHGPIVRNENARSELPIFICFYTSEKKILLALIYGAWTSLALLHRVGDTILGGSVRAPASQKPRRGAV